MAAVTAVIPFTVTDAVSRRLGWWVNAVPLVAVTLVVGGIVLLALEFGHFDRVDREHYDAQKPLGLGGGRRPDGPNPFKIVVFVLMVLLLVMGVFVTGLVWNLPST